MRTPVLRLYGKPLGGICASFGEKQGFRIDYTLDSTSTLRMAVEVDIYNIRL